MIKFNSVFLFSLITAFFLLLPVNASAQVNPNCPSVYGAACPTGALSVTKTVQNPKTGEFMTAISAGDATFDAGMGVNFKIDVKNTGSADLNNITVVDQFPRNPDLIDFASGPGNFDSGARTLTWTIGTLKAGETQTFSIGVTVKPVNNLPDQNIVCATNSASAQQDQQSAQNTSVFCVQARVSQVLGVKELPRTGLPAALWLLSGAVLPIGWGLRKFTLGNDRKGIANYIWETRSILRGEVT